MPSDAVIYLAPPCDMCLMGEQGVAMSCRITKANYSHCPLKKRPVYYISEHLDDTTDAAATYYYQSEPENLSTKPEDLQLTCKKFGSSKRVAPICYSHEYFLEECPFCIKSYKNLQKVNEFSIKCEDSEDSLDTITLKKSSEYCYYSPSSNIDHVSMLYPSVLHQFETSNEDTMYYCYPSTVSSEQMSSPYRSSDKLSLHRTFDSNCVKSCTVYEASESFELSPKSSTLSSLHSSYPASSTTPKTHTDLLSISVTGPNSSSTERKWFRKKVKIERTGSRHQCPFCSKSYSTFSGLSNHKDLYHPEENVDSTTKKTFSCTSCEKVYVSLGALKMHIRTHTLPCKCVICGKAFSRPWLLQGHIRTHTGEKPFSCPLCERAFADRSNLRAHLQTHSEVKKYSCSSCRKTFSRMSLLTKHQDSGCSPLYDSSEDHNID